MLHAACPESLVISFRIWPSGICLCPSRRPPLRFLFLLRKCLDVVLACSGVAQCAVQCSGRTGQRRQATEHVTTRSNEVTLCSGDITVPALPMSLRVYKFRIYNPRNVGTCSTHYHITNRRTRSMSSPHSPKSRSPIGLAASARWPRRITCQRYSNLSSKKT